ncbi:hypothetical protein SANTM175S_10435 [Streptomyces antimycoticus]
MDGDRGRHRGRRKSTALVGTPETVAKALLDYVDIGVTTLLIRGYDPLDDAVGYGRELLPLVRQELAHRAGGGRRVRSPRSSLNATRAPPVSTAGSCSSWMSGSQPPNWRS